MNEQLPDGLQLAVNIIREAEWPEGAGGNPLDAVLNEHAQRLTLQHRAADQVWRIADLEVKCVTLKELHDAATDERDALREKHDELLVALHGIGKALGIPEGDRSPYSVTCGALERVNRLAKIEAQEPVCWAVIDPTGGGSVEYTAAWREACHEHIGDMIAEADMPEAANFLVRPLYAQAVPPGPRQAVQDQFTPTLEFRCSRCGVDRFKNPCGDSSPGCPITGIPQLSAMEVRRG